MRTVVVALLLTAALLGCSPTVKDGQMVQGERGVPLQAGAPLGQTFTARDGGLEGIEVFLAPDLSGSGVIRLHLKADPSSSMDLSTASISVQAVNTPGFYSFGFAPQSDSLGRDYYLSLELEGNGRVQVGTAAPETYLDGALYQDGQPADGQMTFRLRYDPVELILGLIASSGLWLRVLVMTALVFVIPGWALCEVLLDFTSLSWGEKLGLATGLGLAIYPVFLLWTDAVGLHLGPANAWLAIAAGIATLMWRHRSYRPRLAFPWPTWLSSSAFWPDVGLVVLLGLVFALRFWLIRSIDIPMWGDSYQHAMIAQLIADHGGLFRSWMPYVPYQTLTVQFGFPVDAAILSWMVGMDVPQATLWMGQVLNGLAILTLYPLALRLSGRNRWAGVGCVLIGGLLSPMPIYYVNWGRYAQLAGQAILPIALWGVWEALESEAEIRRKILFAGCLLAGMVLTYYRTPFYYATFIVAWLVGRNLVQRWGIRRWLCAFMVLGLVAVVGVALVLPWGFRVAGGSLAKVAETGEVIGSPLDGVLADYRVWGDLAFYVPLLLQVLGLAGFAWSLVRKQWLVASLGLWVMGLASLVAGRLVHLPGANLMQNFAVIIALYIPAALLGGWLFGSLARMAEDKGPKVVRTLLLVTVVLIGMWAFGIQRLILQPQTFAIVNRPDMRAMSWIRDHTPPDSVFLVEGFRVYQGLTAVGADGGWWIPLLAQRKNTMPPQYALMNEVSLKPDYTQRVINLVAQLEKESPSSPGGVQLLCDWGITHVYIGQGQGQTGAGAAQLFSPEQFVGSAAFELVYRQDRIRIFRLSPSACGVSN